jgi:putative ABC transport system ATP-binding protein
VKGVHVCLDGVSKSFGVGSSAVQALREIDLRVDPGEFVVVLGDRGSGKTTLIELIAAVERPSTGTIVVGPARVDLLDERSRLEFRTSVVGLVPQQPTLAPSLSPHETVARTAALRHVSDPDRLASDLLRTVGLVDEPEPRTAQLSEDEQQRLSIARALATDTPLLLADEPTAPLRPETGRRMHSVLWRLSRERSTTVLLTAAAEGSLDGPADQVIDLRAR